MSDNYDLIVIGAGPGGYAAAIRAAQLGLKTACIEKDNLGGTCLNIGCIPSKALLDSSERYVQLKHGLDKHGIKVEGIQLDLAKMMARKADVVKTLTGGVGSLFRKYGVTHIKGVARIVSPGVVETRTSAGAVRHTTERILIATGSVPIELPNLPFDGANILSSTEALSLTEVPQKLIVVGGGYIGVELGSVWSRLGSQVTVLEYFDRALPNMDKEMAGQLQKMLEKQGITFRFQTIAESAVVENGKVKLTWVSGEKRGVEEVDKVLVAVGRRPIAESLGTREVGIETDRKGYITVDKRFATSVPGIYAIGDVIGGLMLAHKAEAEGVACVEALAGQSSFVNYKACPSVVYTHPELAQVGLTEEEAAKLGPIRVGRFPFAANGRARGMDATLGLVKVIGDEKTDRLLGVHILGEHASDMIAEAALAMEFAATLQDIGRAFHAHPTLPESIKQAALLAHGEATQF